MAIKDRNGALHSEKNGQFVSNGDGESSGFDVEKLSKEPRGRSGTIRLGVGEQVKAWAQGTIKVENIEIGRSIGAKARNYKVLDLKTGEFFRFAEGTKLQNVTVFCGAGTKHVYRKAHKYSKRFGGLEDEWQHVKAIGILDTPNGYMKANVHWSQHPVLG